MKKAFISTCAAASAFILSLDTGAQSSSFIPADGMTMKAARPAGSGSRMLTMEEAVLSRPVSPERLYGQWLGESTIMLFKDGKMTLFDAAKGNEVNEDPALGPASGKAGDRLRKSLPEGAENVTPNPDADSFSSSADENIALAFTLGNSLYYIDTEGDRHTVAESGNTGIVYGQSVSRNEFGTDGGIFWSPDGSMIAFYRKDESRVSDFPLLDITTRTGTLKAIKYPMNGMDSERVSLGIYSLSTGFTTYVRTCDFGEDRYLTNITWSPDSRHIFIQVLDRSQKHLRLNMYRASDGHFEKTVLCEDNDRYVEPLDKLHWFGNTGRFIYRTDCRDGYRNLYLCDTTGNVERVTKVDADVKFVAEDGQRIFYTSAEVSPVENHLFSINVSITRKGVVKVGTPVRLTQEEGWHNISMNDGCTWFIDQYSSFNTPGVAKVKSVDGKTNRTLLEAADPLKEYATGEMIFGTVKSADGQYDNWYRLYLPKDFDPSKKYPVILYVYGGPHSQMVTDSWLGQIRMWEMYMAQHGYIVYVQDNRGTQNRGAEYEKIIHKHCGQAEMADQMAGMNVLMTLPYVDKDRIGVHGWSYGGFMTISLMTDYPDVFKVGVAGGPVIDWKWYEIMYGERYMETEETNPDGFAATSLIGKARNLKGRLLICQGAIDNTVVWEHSLSFINECIRNHVQVDYFPYPCAEHNVFGRDRIHLMDKVTLYFEDYLK